jgi:hypothetical protein
MMLVVLFPFAMQDVPLFVTPLDVPASVERRTVISTNVFQVSPAKHTIKEDDGPRTKKILKKSVFVFLS